MTAPDGTLLRYDVPEPALPGLIASNGTAHDRVVAALRAQK